MKNRVMIRLFLCLALIQLILPLSMIAKREIVLKNGVQFKFKVAPVDPYDAFRGRYVALSVDESYVPEQKETKLKYGQTVFALIAVDAQGFAQLTGVTLSRPRDKSYLQANVATNISYDNKVYLNLPINRYYLEENAAPRAENIYRQHVQPGKKDAYVLVRIKDGFVVIESLYVGGERIEAAVKAPALQNAHPRNWL